MTISLPFLAAVAISFPLSSLSRHWYWYGWIFTFATPLLFLLLVYKAFVLETGAVGLNTYPPSLQDSDKKRINTFAQKQSKAAQQAKMLVLSFAMACFLLMNCFLGWDGFYANLPASFIAVGPSLLVAVFYIQHIIDIGTGDHRNDIIHQANERARQVGSAVHGVRNIARLAGRVEDEGGIHRVT